MQVAVWLPLSTSSGRRCHAEVRDRSLPGRGPAELRYPKKIQILGWPPPFVVDAGTSRYRAFETAEEYTLAGCCRGEKCVAVRCQARALWKGGWYRSCT